MKVDWFVKNQEEVYGIEKVCAVLEINRSSYYKRQRVDQGKKYRENRDLLEKVRVIHKTSNESYGSPRITEELRSQGHPYNKKRIARIMRKNGITAKIYRKYKNTTNSEHNHDRCENILNRAFNREKPNEVWTSDITYIRTTEGWLYLAAVIDLYSRKVIGWQLDKRLNSELVERALENALLDRKIEEGIIFHSDQGIQYASGSFRKLLKKYGFKQSMSRRGNCYDNAITESFFHTLKTELIYRNKYRTREEARRSIFEYIEIFYNRKRLHSAIGYKSPVEYEKLT